MSVLISVKIQGDTAAFRTALSERSGEFTKIAEMGRGAGCLHHQFGIGDGFVTVNDEWETAADFETFFSNPDLHAFIASVGAAPTPPEITISEAVTSGDQF